MLTVLGTVEEVAADVVAAWAEVSRMPRGYVGEPTARRRQRRDAELARDHEEHDVLGEIRPPEYVQALCRVEVPERGGTIRCSLPGHDERTGSFHVYDDAARGWYCFGCGRGGTIYDLGAALWGISTRGPAFRELRRELARELLRAAA
jgi:hypothetical protein